MIGVDEVGRGPLAGPVSICVFASRPADLLGLFPKNTLKDSKQLSHANRAKIVQQLTLLKEKNVVDFEILHRSSAEIDRQGIAVCIREMIDEALHALISRHADITSSTEIFLDGGLRAPEIYTSTQTIVRGDAQVVEIACASILAKEERDGIMRSYGQRYPEYGFESHMGYATKAHRQALLNYGKIEIHRNSFIHFL